MWWTKNARHLLPVVCAVLLCGCATGGASGGTDGWNGRIDISDVNYRNWERFVAQLERDVPVGTPVEDLKRYLSENGIEYGHFRHPYAGGKHRPPDDGWVSVGVRDILRNPLFEVVGFSSGLQVQFYIVHEEGDVPRVSRIEGTLLHTFL